MKKITALFSTLLLCSVLLAQVPANKTAYDCSGNTETIYDILGTGRSVIVLHKGVDCSICRNSAPGWQTWAAANTTNVRVWGAITYTYSSSQFNTTNMCQKTTSWKSQYNWNDIFTFPDSSREWVNGGSPRYYVYSAIDSSIVYQGPNSTTARNTALAQSTVGLSKIILNDSKIYFDSYNLRIENLDASVNSYRIFNPKGQMVAEGGILNGNAIVSTNGFSKGVYIVQLIDNNNKTESRKVIFY